MWKHDRRHGGDNPSSTAISYSQQCALTHSTITPPEVFSMFFIIDRERKRSFFSKLCETEAEFVWEMEIDHEIQKLKWFPSHTATYSEAEHSETSEEVKQREVKGRLHTDSIIHGI